MFVVIHFIGGNLVIERYGFIAQRQELQIAMSQEQDEFLQVITGSKKDLQVFHQNFHSDNKFMQ